MMDFSSPPGGAANNASHTYVTWTWKAGGNKNTFNVDDVGYASAAAAGLDSGSITPTGASVGTKQGFSMIRYTGTNSNDSVPHGLLQAPRFVIVKSISASQPWVVGHYNLGFTKYLWLIVQTPGRFIDCMARHTTNILGFYYWCYRWCQCFWR